MMSNVTSRKLKSHHNEQLVNVSSGSQYFMGHGARIVGIISKIPEEFQHLIACPSFPQKFHILWIFQHQFPKEICHCLKWRQILTSLEIELARIRIISRITYSCKTNWTQAFIVVADSLLSGKDLFLGILQSSSFYKVIHGLSSKSSMWTIVGDGFGISHSPTSEP